MFNMSDSSVKLKSNEKLYTFPFKYTSLDSISLNQSDILPKQNQLEKLRFLLSA